MQLGELFSRYLRLVGVTDTPSGEDGLNELVRAHLMRVPFENLSKLLLVARHGSGRITNLDEFLDGIEHRDLGGTCYTITPFFCSLLRALGYDAYLLGADMAAPNVHVVMRIRLQGRDYHVDTGYAAPFARAFPIDGSQVSIACGNLHFRVNAGENVRVDDSRDGGYIAHGPPRDAEFFRQVILDSYLPGSYFMQRLRITRFFDDRMLELRNRRVLRYHGASWSEWTADSEAELERIVRDEFQMPRCPLREAIASLEQITGASFWTLSDRG